jgi:hypothetical protein
LHIHEIIKNESYQNKLITFFACKYYESHNSQIKTELFWIIANLQLLITEYIGYYDFDKNISDIYIDIKIINLFPTKKYNCTKEKYNYMVFQYSSIDYINFSIILNNIYKENEHSKQEFCNFIILNKEKLFNSYKVILEKHFPNSTLKDNIFTIDSDKYIIHEYTNDFVLQLFDVIQKIMEI